MSQRAPGSVEPRCGRPTSTGSTESAGATRTALGWAYALTIGRFGITAAVTIVMAAFLEPRAYGVMALAMVWVSFAQGLALYGPTQAVIQREDVTSRHFDAAFWVAIGVAVVETIAFVALAPLWASINDAPDLTYVCWAIAPAILLNALVVVPDAILRRRLEFRRLSQRVLAAGILSGVAGVAVAIGGGGVWALVVQQLTLTGLSLVAIWSISPWRPSIGSVGPALRDLRKFSASLGIGVLRDVPQQPVGRTHAGDLLRSGRYRTVPVPGTDHRHGDRGRRRWARPVLATPPVPLPR